MKLQPVIGLEIHLQLKTRSKMFCSCPTHDQAIAPNTHICPICMGHPGTLPVPNQETVRAGILMGLALHCTITEHSKFDRKNYFYPDLPKAYQISQFDLPVAKEGFLEMIVLGSEFNPHRFGITRVHLEEDSGKSFHGEDGRTFVDFNRAGTPLIEIVTEPDFHSPPEAKAFLQELRLIARYLNLSDADMEKGHLRCDVNISLRELDKKGEVIGPSLHPKTEIKNINSFRHVERALNYEIQRQTELWEAGTPPDVETTRGWDEKTQTTIEQRTKEGAKDYRYFPEPDIPPLNRTTLKEELTGTLPELPTEKRTRFVTEYGFKHEDARHLCEDPALANYTEQVYSELLAWLESLSEEEGQDFEKQRTQLARLIAGWLLSKLGGLMAERAIDIRILKITPENFAEFITLIATKKLNTATAMKVLTEMLETGTDPSHVMEDRQLGQMDDESAIAEVINRVLEQHPQEVLRYQQGETQLIKFFLGLIMKETEGNADPALAKNTLLVKLES